MRLFIAFEIPKRFSSDLIAAQKCIRAKSTLPKTFHLTLKFIGEVEDNKVPSLITQLEKINFGSFNASFSDIGAFPDVNAARVVWLGLEPKQTIADVAKQIESAAKGFGDSADAKHFVPHITLARIKFIENSTDKKKEFADSLRVLTPPKDSFRIDSFKLIKSVLTPQGPVYEVLKSFAAHQQPL